MTTVVRRSCTSLGMMVYRARNCSTCARASMTFECAVSWVRGITLWRACEQIILIRCMVGPLSGASFPPEGKAQNVHDGPCRRRFVKALGGALDKIWTGLRCKPGPGGVLGGCWHGAHARRRRYCTEQRTHARKAGARKRPQRCSAPL